MRLETLRALTAWLNDGTYGVNAQLASVPRDGSDALPADFALIAEATSNQYAARGQMPTEDTGLLPCLLL